MPDYNKFEVREAVVAPVRTDDLQHDVADFIGKTIWVEYDGKVDHECDYTGDDRWHPLFRAGDLTDIPPAPTATWIPGCDLRIGALIRPGIAGYFDMED